MVWLPGAVLLALASVVAPQGNIGGTQNPPCTSNAQDTWVSRGCFRDFDVGPHLNMEYEILPPSPLDKRSYPTFNRATMTSEMCQTACRGHGAKWAVTYQGNRCFCSAYWSSPNSTYNLDTYSGPPNNPPVGYYGPRYFQQSGNDWCTAYVSPIS